MDRPPSRPREYGTRQEISRTKNQSLKFPWALWQSSWRLAVLLGRSFQILGRAVAPLRAGGNGPSPARTLSVFRAQPLCQAAPLQHGRRTGRQRVRRTLPRRLCRALSGLSYDQFSALQPVSVSGLACPLWRSKELRARQHLHDLPPMVGWWVADAEDQFCPRSRPSHGVFIRTTRRDKRRDNHHGLRPACRIRNDEVALPLTSAGASPYLQLIGSPRLRQP
jgi:hypothetical protein